MRGAYRVKFAWERVLQSGWLVWNNSFQTTRDEELINVNHRASCPCFGVIYRHCYGNPENLFPASLLYACLFLTIPSEFMALKAGDRLFFKVYNCELWQHPSSQIDKGFFRSLSSTPRHIMSTFVSPLREKRDPFYDGAPSNPRNHFHGRFVNVPLP